MTMPRDELLELETRRRIHALVKEYPGLHLREVARQLDTSVALVEYHVPFLVNNGLLEARTEGHYTRLYTAKGPAPEGPEKHVVALLRARLPLQVTLYLLDQEGPVKHGQISDDLGIAKSKLSFHLRKLVHAEIVEKRSDGAFAVRDPGRIHRILVDWKPTPGMRHAFADLWLSLYGDHDGR